jgi:hypothetical protein
VGGQFQAGSHVLLHEQHGAAEGMHALDVVVHIIRGPRIQTRRRLVEYHQHRVERQGASKFNGALLSTGEGACPLMGTIPDDRELLRHVGQSLTNQRPVPDHIRPGDEIRMCRRRRVASAANGPTHETRRQLATSHGVSDGIRTHDIQDHNLAL